MEYRLLGGSGLSVPVLTLGTVTFTDGSDEAFRSWGNTGVDEAARMVDICLEAGACMIDCADIYSDGVSETILGQAIRGKRNRLLLSTKAAFRFGDDPNGVGTSRQHLVASCEDSLKRLGTDHIDLWQMHGFDALTPVEETMRALDDLVRAGKVRYIGCSNYSGWQVVKSLWAADRHGWTPFVAQQIYYSLLAREYEWELMPMALANRMGALVWSPLSQGRLTGKVGRNRPAPAGTRLAQGGGDQAIMGGRTDEELYRIVDELEIVAKETGRSVSQVALNWVLHRPTVATLIIGARTEAQLRDNLKTVEFRLAPEQVKRLDRASSRPLIYPYWHQLEVYSERNPFPVELP